MQPVRVAYEKSDGRPHWEFDALRLGVDDHGVWLGVRRGTHQARPGLSVAAAADHVVLVAASGEHCTTFHSDRDRAAIEVYVDITCGHRWQDGRITMFDLDLDVIRRWDGTVVIDDEDEFAAHRVRFEYPDDVVESALAATQSLQSQLERESAPFDGQPLEVARSSAVGPSTDRAECPVLD